MGYDLTAENDWSKYGNHSDSTVGGADYTHAYATAVSDMEADGWSKDAVALGDVTNQMRFDWSGRLPHIIYDSPTFGSTYHILRKSTSSDHIRIGDPYVSYCNATTTALANSFMTFAHAGESITSLQLYMKWNQAFPSGMYPQVSFRVTSTETPDSSWSWVTDSPVFVMGGLTTSLSWYTFTTSFTMGNWLWVIVSFSPYTMPLPELNDLMTNTKTYSINWTNDIKVNYT
jgi:hypothetical protein